MDHLLDHDVKLLIIRNLVSEQMSKLRFNGSGLTQSVSDDSLPDNGNLHEYGTDIKSISKRIALLASLSKP